MIQKDTVKPQLISIVAPAYNESDVLHQFYTRVNQDLENINIDIEIIYINDGSHDDTSQMMHEQAEKDERITIIDLSRNFGKEIALTAGLDYASGDAIVIIDVDLQDPPELIPEFIKYWQEGYDVVSAKRIKRHGETRFKRLSSFIFYRLLSKFSEIHIPEDTGDFRLMSKPAVNALIKLRERHRYMKGLYAWIGFKHKCIDFERPARIQGNSKWGIFKLLNLAIDGLTSFSVIPLKLASVVGILTAIISFSFGVFIFMKKIIFGDPVAGYTSLAVIITFLGSIQLLALGIIGEYLGRIYNETKNRPLYLIKDIHSSIYAKSRSYIETEVERI